MNGSSDAGVSRYAAAVLADAPIGYWRFEETSGNVAHDSSGHGHDGFYGANVILGQTGLVGEGFAVRFDGSADASPADYVRVLENADLQPSSSVTIECWAMPTSGDAILVMYGMGDASKPFPYALFLAGATVAANWAGSTPFPYVSTDVPPRGVKHHLVAVYDGASLRFYRDGVVIGTAAASGPLGDYDTVNGLGIGSDFQVQGTDPRFVGVIDEVAVYSTPLTSQQVAAHYAAGR
jgi:hypothetical protein